MNKCALLKYTGHQGYEPRTCRSAVECSTTELYPDEYRYKYHNIII